MNLFAQEEAALLVSQSQQKQFALAMQNPIFSDFLSTFQNIRQDVSLKDYCNFLVGGKAKLFYEITNELELVEIFRYLREHELELPIVVMGQGCNLLVADAGISALVLYLGPKFAKLAWQRDYTTWDYPYLEEAIRQLKLKNAQFEQADLQDYCLIHAQAGQTLKELSSQTAEKAYTGLEFACGIPGTLGGTTYMNAGAYGGQVSDCILGVRYLAQNGEIVELRPSYMDLNYRSSYFMQAKMQGAVILGISYLVKKAKQEDIQRRVIDLTNKRTTMQPLDLPSAGSIFKRPVPYYAGKLISDAGLKAYNIDGAEVSPLHAGFIVNSSRNCTARAICQLIHHVQTVIKDMYDVTLETEVRYMGDFTQADFVRHK